MALFPAFSVVPLSTPPPRRLIHELKNRKVFRVAVVYAVVGFMIVEVADIVFPALHLPDWTVTLVVVLALLGLPVAVVLAWAYDLTPDGVKRAAPGLGTTVADTSPAARDDSTDSRLVAGVGIGVIVGLIGFGAAVYVTGSAESEDAPAMSIRSIAVLPFANLSVEEENAFFAAGMHDEVLTHLGRIGDLQVISKTSVQPYAGTSKGIVEIGRELGVRAVMEGSVQRYGNQIRVTAVLIDAATDQQLWAESYDRGLEDLFALQTEIALAIAQALEARLTPEERRRVERSAPTEDLEAFRQYVLGIGHLDQRTESSMRRSIPFFERAIARDSSYAEAWVGLADAYILLHDYGYAVGDVLPLAEDALSKVMALDHELAFASQAGLHMTRREWPEAMGQLRRAVEVQPGSANAHSWRSWVALLLGLREEGLEAARVAVDLDPLHAEAVSNLALSLMANDDGEAGLTAARRIGEIAPEFTTGPLQEGMILYRLGQFPEARDLLDGIEAEWAGEGPRATLALAHIAVGDTAAGRDLLPEIEAAGDRFATGLVLTTLGETEDALQAFDEVEELSPWPVLVLRYFPPELWDPVRGDPRYDRLLREVDRNWTVGSEPVYGS